MMRDRDKAIAWGVIFLVIGTVMYFFIPKIILIFFVLGIIIYHFREKIDLV